MTHAFFKAVLFLGAGSVIIAHAPRAGHAQDGRPAQVHADHLPHHADRRAGQRGAAAVRRLLLQGHDHRGGARCRTRPGRRFRLSWRCCSACSSAASTRSGWCSTPSTARSALPIRMTPRCRRPMPSARRQHDAHAMAMTTMRTPHESPWVVTVPLILLAIPSIVRRLGDRRRALRRLFRQCDLLSAGASGDGRAGAGIPRRAGHDAARPDQRCRSGWRSPVPAPPGTSTSCVPICRRCCARKAGVLVTILMEKYGFDRFNDWFFAGGARWIGTGCGSAATWR